MADSADKDNARIAMTAAGQAHDIERAMLSLAEQFRRGETPDPVSVALLQSQFRGLRDCLGVLFRWE